MSGRAGLGERSLSTFLNDEEQALLRRSDVRRIESLDGLLRTSPSLERVGVRRQLLLNLIEAQLPPGYVPGRARDVTFGAWQGEMSSWPPRRAPEQPFTGRMASLSLLDRIDARNWLPRDQLAVPTCSAQAAVACIELMRTPDAGRVSSLSTHFVDRLLRHHRPALVAGQALAPGQVPRGADMAKLSEAAMVFDQFGVCEDHQYDEVVHQALPLPPQLAMEAAAHNRWRAVFYQDRPKPEDRAAPGFARLVYAELTRGRPVAVAAPGFRDVRLGDDAPTTWSHADFWESGNLRMAGPPRDVLVPGSGHAVCVVGFQADDDEPAGGHFVFRNSWGRDFARAANTTIGTPTIPFSPLRGFGTLPAEYVERHCWEAVSFARQA